MCWSRRISDETRSGELQPTQNKGPGAAAPVRAIQPLRVYITTCLRSFEARKAIFLLALILMASAAAGLRPMRAGADIGERETAGTDLGPGAVWKLWTDR